MLGRSATAALIGCMLLGGASVPGSAQEYPTKPITIMVGTSPGGITDLIGRLVAEYVSRETGQKAVVENRGGAGGNIAMAAVAKAAPDGYTLGLVNTGNLTINPFTIKHMPLDTLKDLVPIAPIAEAPQMIAIHVGVPAKTLKEFVALAKAHPRKFSYGSAGLGSTMQIAAEQFARLAGIELVHVPYRGATPAVTDLMAGNVQVISVSIGPLRPAIDSGKVRVLATATKQRLPYLPDVPTSAEAGVPGYEMSTWFALVAPAGTPQPVVERLNKLVQGMLADPAVRKRLAGSQLELMHMSAAEFAKFVKAEYEQWGQAVREAGIEPN